MREWLRIDTIKRGYGTMDSILQGSNKKKKPTIEPIPIKTRKTNKRQLIRIQLTTTLHKKRSMA